MRQAIILGHPNPRSFNAAMARAYADGVRASGHEVVVRDLYAMDFDPRLRARELPWSDDFSPGPDVLAERTLLADVDVFAFIYPLWFNAPPAMIKGYVERVFGMGFGYDRAGAGSTPMLRGRIMVSFTSSGAPGDWTRESGAFDRLRDGFDNYLAEICGLTVLEHRHFGGIVPAIRPDFVREMLDDVRATAIRLFGAPSTASNGDP